MFAEVIRVFSDAIQNANIVMAVSAHSVHKSNSILTKCNVVLSQMIGYPAIGEASALRCMYSIYLIPWSGG